MGLFNRKPRREDSGDDGSNSENKKEKGGWRRPANTAFKQQRLKAWQPILTPKTVLPTFFIIGLLFGPIGGLLIWGSSLVSEMTFDYSQCENLEASTQNGSYTFSDVPSYSYRLRSSDSGVSIPKPQMALLNNTGNASVTDVSQELQCVLQFSVPRDLEPSVFLYYKLTNFYQNHRRYVKSLDSDQLKGSYVSPSDLDSSDCKPLGTRDGKAIYPCGLIANSIFNDTFSSPVLLNPTNETQTTAYQFSSNNIAWAGEAKKYTTSPISSSGYSSADQIVPPPNWMKRYPDGYNDSNVPNLKEDSHFQNWMRTAGLPTFTKLYGRNDADTMVAGRYEMVIGLNFPVLPYKGTKSVVITTVSWIGGKNPFLGWAYVAAAALFVLLAVVGTARHLIKPRRLGDMTLLSWNRT
ncbi:cell cycle control protein [Desarmillaria tabescens]|uniref:Cell cycle control protein n=1 Tax=Armillaria tabescens TaxID=1929756 RepID=A0AA39JV26_ARMTA|nr:cell cycle control protein [Desarmillaria tabescens]KAK0448361.1 cell cycle control protein [Desarmillaria tabescens]